MQCSGPKASLVYLLEGRKAVQGKLKLLPDGVCGLTCNTLHTFSFTARAENIQELTFLSTRCSHHVRNCIKKSKQKRHQTLQCNSPFIHWTNHRGQLSFSQEDSFFQFLIFSSSIWSLIFFFFLRCHATYLSLFQLSYLKGNYRPL